MVCNDYTMSACVPYKSLQSFLILGWFIGSSNQPFSPGAKMNTALAFDIWLKATVSICVCVIILTLVAALVQWRRRRGQEEYTVIPPSDTTRRHQGKPKAMLLKGYQASFSGITQPMMKTTIIWSTYGWIWNKQRYFHDVTMSSLLASYMEWQWS